MHIFVLFGNVFNISLKNISRYRNGSRAMPLTLFNKLIKLSNFKFSDFQGKLEIKIEKSGKYIKIGPIINIDEEWVYISELIKGDGHITPNFWHITFVNQDKNLILFLKLKRMNQTLMTQFYSS